MASGAHLTLVLCLCGLAACTGRSDTLTARGRVGSTTPPVVIDEIMANPRAVADDHGEWIELQNLESSAIDLGDWTLTSQNDRGVTIDRSVVVPPRGFIVLGRDANRSANGGIDVAFAFPQGITLGNGSD